MVLPRKYWEISLEHCHDNVTCGHNGGCKTFERVKASFFSLAKMRDLIKRWVSTCIICQRRKRRGAKPKAKLNTYLVGSIGERVRTDLMRPFSETDKGNHWILCIGDLFSKYYVSVGLPFPDAPAVTVSEAFIANRVAYFGIPLEL